MTDRFTDDGRETLAGMGRIWETTIKSKSGDDVRVRRVGTHVMRKGYFRYLRPGMGDEAFSKEQFVDYRVSIGGRLVNSFLTKPQALRFAKSI